MFWILIVCLFVMILVIVLKNRKTKKVKALINNKIDLEFNIGDSLLFALGDNKIYLPSICGGGGTCSLCKCQILKGGGALNLIEKQLLSENEISNQFRLVCQIKVSEDIILIVDEDIIKC